MLGKKFNLVLTLRTLLLMIYCSILAFLVVKGIYLGELYADAEIIRNNSGYLAENNNVVVNTVVVDLRPMCGTNVTDELVLYYLNKKQYCSMFAAEGRVKVEFIYAKACGYDPVLMDKVAYWLPFVLLYILSVIIFLTALGVIEPGSVLKWFIWLFWGKDN